MTNNEKHQYFMQQALNYASQGAGRTAENPSVGCVIVKDGQIIGIGRTADGGRPHAEVVALAGLQNCTKEAMADLSIYVTLEPCAHHGKTPPCVDAIIASGIKQVIIATLDDDDRVRGAGVAHLQQAGVTVQIGVLEAQAKRHHRGFLRRVRSGLPEIMLKIATSADEKITAPERWITGELARNYGQILRSRYDAIVTGIGTIAADNPLLNCRLAGLEQYSPLRVVLDRGLNINIQAKIVQDAKNMHHYDARMLVLTANNNAQKIAQLAKHNVEVVVLEADFTFADAMASLGAYGINSVMVEGGQAITTSALNSGLVDDLYWFVAKNKIIGGAQNINAVAGGTLQNYLKEASLQQTLNFSDDALYHYWL